jgi:hypothetical protein
LINSAKISRHTFRALVAFLATFGLAAAYKRFHVTGNVRKHTFRATFFTAFLTAAFFAGEWVFLTTLATIVVI